MAKNLIEGRSLFYQEPQSGIALINRTGYDPAPIGVSMDIGKLVAQNIVRINEQNELLGGEVRRA